MLAERVGLVEHGEMREQLGLMLESTRMPINVLVVDRVGPPSEN